MLPNLSPSSYPRHRRVPAAPGARPRKFEHGRKWFSRQWITVTVHPSAIKGHPSTRISRELPLVRAGRSPTSSRGWRNLKNQRKSPSQGSKNTATVDLSEFTSAAAGTEPVVLSSKTTGAKSESAKGPKKQSLLAANAPSPSSFPDPQLRAARAFVSNIAATVQGVAAPIIAKGNLKGAGLVWAIALGTAAVLAVVALIVRRKPAGERTVEALARRGFISSDRSVPLQLIQDYEDPTMVRDYSFGSAKLVELEPLKPLTEEKMQYHRELRRKEHGWKKPEQILVEGEPVPEGVDPMTVRFIPKKHPFALSSDEVEEKWSEDVARRRLRQRKGRPEKELQRSRIQLERLRREMELREAAMGKEGINGDIAERKSGFLPNMDD